VEPRDDYPFLGAERTSSQIVEVFRHKPEGGREHIFF
jgi:hypothetical protein